MLRYGSIFGIVGGGMLNNTRSWFISFFIITDNRCYWKFFVNKTPGELKCKLSWLSKLAETTFINLCIMNNYEDISLRNGVGCR